MKKSLIYFLLIALTLGSCQANLPVPTGISFPDVNAAASAYPVQAQTAYPIAPAFTPPAYIPPGSSLPSATPRLTITPGMLLSERLGYQWINYLSAGTTIWTGSAILTGYTNSITAIDPSTGRQRWRAMLPGTTANSFSPFVVTGQLVIAFANHFSGEGPQTLNLVALDLASGDQVWERSIQEIPAGNLGIATVALLAADNAVLVVSKLLEAISPTDGRTLWSRDESCSIPYWHTSGTNWQAPAGTFLLVCPSSKSVLNLDAANGTVLGEMKTRSPINEVSLFGDTMVIVSPDINSNSGAFSVLGYRWPSGELLWQQAYSGAFGGWVARGDRLAYCAGNLIRQVDPANGNLVWETQIVSLTGSNLVLSGSSLLAGSQDGIAARLDWSGGRLLWQQDLWAGLDPPWSRITILGESGKTLLLNVSGYSGIDSSFQNALAALRPDAPSAWLTPAPTATPVPPEAHVPTATLPPSGFLQTPPPPLSPGWTPEPPPVVANGQSGNAVLPVYLRLAANLLAFTHGNLVEFVRQVQAWGKLHSYVPGGAIWARQVDLNGDGQAEIIASLPLLKEVPETDTSGYTGIVCGSDFGCDRLVAIFQLQGSNYIPTGLIIQNGSPWLEDPEFLTVDNLDGDGRPEVVLKVTTLGMIDTNHIVFGRWDGSSWLPVTGNNDLMGSINQVQFVTRAGLAGKVMEVTFDPFPVNWNYGRTHIRTYAWKAGQPQEIQDVPQPSNDPYFLLMDAHTALMRGQTDRGLALALKAFQPGTGPHVELSIENDRILSFAVIDAMLAYAVKGDPISMQGILDELNANFRGTPNPYLSAAQRLMDVYKSTHDPKPACEEMAAVIRQNWEDASLLRKGMISTDSIDLADICPLQ